MEHRRKPVIFCHYGNSPYLNYTLRQAKRANPENRIILLGDKKNKSIAERAKVEHYFFENYIDSSENLTFEKVYQHVAGKKHGRKNWTKFVFQRWFHIHEFIRKESINSFWHFDSDNMILANLEGQEYKFRDFDCTEQCHESCMNGYISSFEVVDGYIKKINELFENEEYLNEQRADFVKHPEYAFTEMRAYAEYKKQENIKTIRLNTIINNESYDECICHSHGYETYEYSINRRFLKKLYIDSNGSFYCYHIASSSYTKMNSLNLSWVPNRLYKLILEIYTTGYSKHVQRHSSNEFFVLDLSFLVKSRKNLKSRLRVLIPDSVQQSIRKLGEKFL